MLTEKLQILMRIYKWFDLCFFANKLIFIYILSNLNIYWFISIFCQQIQMVWLHLTIQYSVAYSISDNEGNFKLFAITYIWLVFTIHGQLAVGGLGPLNLRKTRRVLYHCATVTGHVFHYKIYHPINFRIPEVSFLKRHSDELVNDHGGTISILMILNKSWELWKASRDACFVRPQKLIFEEEKDAKLV
jgi:hypothetical protein